MTLPLEAQECANCYYARQTNLFNPTATATGSRYVHCHENRNSVTPVFCDAWCGQWRIHPEFAALAFEQIRDA